MKTCRNIGIGCLSVVLLLLLILNHLTFRVGYRIPGGEIDFIGLTKVDVVKKILEKDLVKSIDVEGDNTRHCRSLNEAISDHWIMQSDLWGVNYQTAGIVMYRQLLFFDKDGKVYKQSIKKNNDGL